MYDSGWIVALWAIMIPIVMLILFVVPLYVMGLVCLWNVYGDSMWQHWADVSTVLYYLEYLYAAWEADQQLTTFNYLIPVFGPLFLGLMLSAVLIYLFYRYIRGVFEVS